MTLQKTIFTSIAALFTLSTNALLRAGYADNAEAALTELNQKDN